jgi:hypothetical protein
MMRLTGARPLSPGANLTARPVPALTRNHIVVDQLGYPVDNSRPLQLVIAAVHAAPDPESLAVVDLVAVMLMVGVGLARQTITDRVCPGKLEQGPDLIISWGDAIRPAECSSRLYICLWSLLNMHSKQA